ncbi:MAG: hypothetical protein JWR39_2625 [Devosia sp.]|jgi:hypothetical protein|nr:hypothetical protein [Devosia sp.]
MGAIHEIVFDCEQPAELAQFWVNLLDGYTLREQDEAELSRLADLGLAPDAGQVVMVDGPGPSICFQNIDGRRPDNNRVHFDIVATDRPSEVEKLKEVGAEIVRVLPTYTILRDPEGNQFFLIDNREAIAA